MPANDPKKTSALLEAMERELARTAKAVERAETEAADWLKQLDRVDKLALDAAASLTKIVDHLKSRQEAARSFRESLMLVRARRFQSDQLLDNQRRRLVDAGNAVLEMRKNALKKEQAASEKKDDKKARMEHEMAQKALEKAESALMKLSLEVTAVSPVSEAQAVADSLTQGKKDMLKYEAIVSELVRFGYERGSVLNDLLKNIEQSMTVAEKWAEP